MKTYPQVSEPTRRYPVWLALGELYLAHQAAGHAQGLCLDASYDSKQVRETLTDLAYPVPIRPRGEEVQGKKAGQKARR